MASTLASAGFSSATLSTTRISGRIAAECAASCPKISCDANNEHSVPAWNALRTACDGASGGETGATCAHPNARCGSGRGHRIDRLAVGKLPTSSRLLVITSKKSKSLASGPRTASARLKTLSMTLALSCSPCSWTSHSSRCRRLASPRNRARFSSPLMARQSPAGSVHSPKTKHLNWPRTAKPADLTSTASCRSNSATVTVTVSSRHRHRHQPSAVSHQPSADFELTPGS